MSEVRFDTFYDDEEREPISRPEPKATPSEPGKKAVKTKKPRKIGGGGSKKWPILVAAVIAVVIAGLGYLAFWQYQENERLKTPEGIAAIAEKENSELVAKVSVLIRLPDEDPVIATVDDKDKLHEQPFFADAENGDKVLIFSAASKAVIYRPSENRIINSGPIAITAEGTEAEQSAQ